MKVNSFSLNVGERVAIYGEPKTGKTQLAAELAKYFKLYWLDLERGVRTLITCLSDEEKENVFLSSVPDTPDNPTAVVIVDAILRGQKVWICDAHGVAGCAKCKANPESGVLFDINNLGPDDVLVIDSFSQVSSSALSYATRGLADGAKVEWDHYGTQGFYLNRILTNIQQARCNIVVITHEADIEGADGEEKIRPVAGTKNFSKKFAKYFDHVIYTELKNYKHVAASSTGYRTNIVSGSRSDLALEKVKVAEGIKLAMLFFKSKPEEVWPQEIKDAFAEMEAGKKAAPAPAAKPTATVSEVPAEQKDVKISLFGKKS